MAFGELALIQSIKRSPYPGMNEEWGGLVDNGDAVVMAIDEPVK